LNEKAAVAEFDPEMEALIEKEKIFQRKAIFIEQFLHEIGINESFDKIQRYLQDLLLNDAFVA
jgi:hypothetical protein